MREAKKRRLAAKGWKVGDATEFLGLTAEEHALIELRIRLADGVRRQRIEHGMTQMALAKALRSSQSRVAKMEAGDPTVSLDLLIRSLIALGVSRRGLARIIGAGTRQAA
jgi:DNA-binding XRE family transcriptional regulator